MNLYPPEEPVVMEMASYGTKIRHVSGCDNSRTYVPEVRQYYGLVLPCFLPRTTWVRGSLLSAYLHFAGTPWPSPRYSIPLFSWHIMCLRCLGMKHDWTNGTKKRWNRLLVYAIVLLFLPRSLNILFRNLYFMKLILMTMKYTLHEDWVCTSASTRQQPLAYQSGTTKNIELSHPVFLRTLFMPSTYSSNIIAQWCQHAGSPTVYKLWFTKVDVEHVNMTPFSDPSLLSWFFIFVFGRIEIFNA
jgi:hypothetical protein